MFFTCAARQNAPVPDREEESSGNREEEREVERRRVVREPGGVVGLQPRAALNIMQRMHGLGFPAVSDARPINATTRTPPDIFGVCARYLRVGSPTIGNLRIIKM